tara:strand:+ start:388 stop:1092 length:705 start_codon:yes stop_codon:yes gene_type:complete
MNEDKNQIPFEERPQLKVFGLMNSGSSFALKPKADSGGSITFTLHMWIPALGSAIFSLGMVYAAYYIYSTNQPKNSVDNEVVFFLAVALAIFLFGAFLLSRWRSVRIFPDGSVELNHPLFFIRKQTRYEPGTAWIEIARKVPDTSSRKLIKRHKTNPKLQELDMKHPEVLELLEDKLWKPILVIHNGTMCFVIALDLEGAISNYFQLLQDEYNIHPSGTDYIVRYGGITDSGRV